MTQLKNKFDGFGRNPSPEVWGKISENLDKDRSKKRLFYYFAAASLILGMILSYNQFSVDSKFDLVNTDSIENKLPETVNQNNSIAENESSESITESENKKTQNSDILNKDQISNENTINDAPTEINPNEITSDENQTSKLASHKNIDEKDQSNTNKETSGIGENENIATINKTESDDNASNKNGESTQGFDSESTNSETIVNEENGSLTLVNLGVKDEAINSIEQDANESINSLTNNDSSNIVDNMDAMQQRTDLDYLSISMAEKITNEAEYRDLKNQRNIDSKKTHFWEIAATFKQSLLDYNAISSSSYSNTSGMDVSVFNLTYNIPMEHDNSRPYWVDLSISKKISPNMGLVLALEYGRIKSVLSVDDEILYRNINKNYAVGFGVKYDVLKKNRVTVSTGALIFSGTSIDKWSEKSSDAGIYTSSSETFVNLESSDLALNFNNYRTTNIFTNAELNLDIEYHISEKIAFHVGPFAKRNISQEYPGSDNFSRPFLWGLSSGLHF